MRNHVTLVGRKRAPGRINTNVRRAPAVTSNDGFRRDKTARERLAGILGRTRRLGSDDPGSEEVHLCARESLPPISCGSFRIAARLSTLAETQIKVWRLSARAAATEVIGLDSDRNVRAHFEITRELRGELETLRIIFHSPHEGALRMHLDGTPLGEIAGTVDRALCRGIVRDLV